jgi:hypothetical protein
MGSGIACRQGKSQVVERHAEAGHALRVQLDMDDLLRAADGVDIASARHALDLFQFLGGTFRILGPKGSRDDGHVVDALGLHDRWQDAEVLRAPVLVGKYGVIQPDQCLGARLADLELHGEYAHAGP